MKRASIVGTLILIAGGAAMAFLTYDASIPVLQPMGPIAAAQMRLILVTLLLASLVVIPVFFLLFFFAWKYRDKSPDAHVHHHPTWDHDSAAAEFIWWLIPSAIIVVLAIIAWQSSHALDPYVPIQSDTPALTVQVVALNWKWLFIYPEQGVAVVNELTIPEDVPIRFVLTADAPMNSFWIPSLGGMIMVMPGMETQLHLAADHAGVFDGYSGNLSGRGFSGMTFKTHAVSSREFNDWISAIRSTPIMLNAQEYLRLTVDSVDEPVRYYSSVAPDLYTSIHARYMTPTTVTPSKL